jgi:hypothetical protein
MELEHFTKTLADAAPNGRWPASLQALWWDARGDWTKAHGLVDDLETTDGMAVHAYLHRREGDAANAEYWYRRAGSQHRRPTLEVEWKVLVEMFLLRVETHEPSAKGR